MSKKHHIKMHNIIYFYLASLLLVSCSISYVHQENIYHSDVDVTTDHKNNADVSPPSLGKDIIKGVRTVADVAEAAVAVDDAERARRDAA